MSGRTIACNAPVFCITKSDKGGTRLVVVNKFSHHKKMTVIFRMEPGSLGPNGVEYINDFCEFAQLQLQACADIYINWAIVPRFDKRLPEMEFQLANKKLSLEKVTQYLALFDQRFEHFEERLENNLEAIINQYFGR
ncbi:MAG: hypothetical protein V5786_04705 [Psychromonas sp.]